MSGMFKVVSVLLVLILVGVAAGAAHSEKRIALVIGNGEYQAGALNTPANDAGLIAQTLQASGFDVVGARDLDQDSLRRTFRDFLDKASASGTDTVTFIYLSGYGLQLEGENYFVPVDAKIARDTDVPVEAVRVSDYTRPLAAMGLKASIVVLDAARANPFARSGQALAGGLALVEPEPGTLIAYNAAPGTVAPEGAGPYGPYAQALAEMMREAGLPLADVFERTRLRVNDTTKGAEVPWHASRVEAPVVFFERTADAPPPAVSPEQTASIRSRPIRDLDAQQAYLEALDRDTLQGYVDFLAAYPDDPMAARVRAIVAARREAITWRRTRVVDTSDAYWSYLERYPHGPHAPDARRRLAHLAAALEPPPSFSMIDYDVPPPPQDEFVYVDRPVLMFDDPYFAFPPPPPLIFFLPPPPPDFILLPPPPPPVEVFVLPIPFYVPVPIWCEVPAYVVPPPNNVIFANIHNTVEINNTTNIVTITNRAGQKTTLYAQPPAASAGTAGRRGASPGVPVIGPTLPPSVAQRALTIRNQNQPPPGGRAQPGQSGQQFPTHPGQRSPQLLGKPLPGTNGLTLPPTTQSRQPVGQSLPGIGGQPLSPAGGTPRTGRAATKRPVQLESQEQVRRPPQSSTSTKPTPSLSPPPVRQQTSTPTTTKPPPLSSPALRRPIPPPTAARATPLPFAAKPTPPPVAARPTPPPFARPTPPPFATRPTPPSFAARPTPPSFAARPTPPPMMMRSPPPGAIMRPSPPQGRPANCGGRPCPR